MRISLSKSQKRGLLIGVCSLVVLLGVAFAYGMSKRQTYLDEAIVKTKTKLKKEYDVNFSLDSCYFTGISTVEFRDVLIVPQDRDTLVRIARLSVSVRIFPLLFREIKIAGVGIDNGSITFVKVNSTSNYDFIFKKKDKSSMPTEEEKSRSFAEIMERLSNQIFAKIPSDLKLNNFAISYTDNKVSQKISVPRAEMNAGIFESSVFLNDQDAEWILEGNVHADDKQIKVAVSSKQPDVELPFLRSKFGVAVSFDKLIFDLKEIKKRKKDLLEVNGIFAYENLKINHRRLSDTTIVLPEAEVEGGLLFAENYIALTEKSTLRVKDFEVSPELKVTLSPTQKIDLAVHTGMFEAQNFFDALPKGLFETLDGVQVEGSIAYDLDFSVDLEKPDNLIFESKIDDEDLKIIKWGNANVDMMNDSFVYDAYSDSVVVRQFIVGPENPNFRRLDQIPYVLKNTVRNTEDPFFYTHNGFEQEAFKLSIATNIKEKKFKRGASTISMQLVKNVFLNRKKTLNRKFEEILLVWLMEASGRVSKDRLFEIYLNVIEWGKNVYGITEAVDYYFMKKPEELTLGESLYLSSIIPRPKTGLSSFDYTGHLKGWLLRHFNTYGSIMRKLGELNNVYIPENYGFYEVQLQPSLRPPAPKVQDTISDVIDEHNEIMREMEEEENVRKSILDKLLKGNDQ